MKTTKQNDDEKQPHLGWSCRKPFEYIAFWQLAAFVALIGLIWANEVLNISGSVFGADPKCFNWLGASLITIFVIVIAIITITHTYIQQRRILQGILIICAYCKKVKVSEEAWQALDSYLTDKTLAEFSHGICPDCAQSLIREHENKTMQPAANDS